MTKQLGNLDATDSCSHIHYPDADAAPLKPITDMPSKNTAPPLKPLCSLHPSQHAAKLRTFRRMQTRAFLS